MTVDRSVCGNRFFSLILQPDTRSNILRCLKPYFSSTPTAAIMLKDFTKDNFCRPADPTDPTDLSPETKPRIRYIDLAKGIAITLVVLYHNALLDHVPGLNATRMPLYFVLSGMFFKTYGNFFKFLQKKSNNLLIPFLFFALIGFLIAVFHFNLKVRYVLLSPIYNPKVHNLPIWFLICLFWVNNLFFVINTLFRHKILRLLIVAGCGIWGYYLHTRQIYLPFFFSSALSAMPFFYFGMLLRNFLLNINLSKIKTLCIALSLLAAGCLYSYFRQSPMIEFRPNLYQGNPVEIYLVSFTMVMSFLLLCKLIVWLPVISYLGRYSIIVLGLHLPVMIGLKELMPPMIGRDLTHLETALIVMLICWLCIPLCRKFFPWFTAQAPLIRPLHRRQMANPSIQQC